MADAAKLIFLALFAVWALVAIWRWMRRDRI
jgi:hypothetical protein